MSETLAFLLELAVLGAACYFGFRLRAPVAVRVLVGVGAPVVLAVVWGLFGSPRAAHKAAGWGRVLLEVLWFGSAAVLLWLAGQRVLALVYLGLYLVNTALRRKYHEV